MLAGVEAGLDVKAEAIDETGTGKPHARAVVTIGERQFRVEATTAGGFDLDQSPAFDFNFSHSSWLHGVAGREASLRELLSGFYYAAAFAEADRLGPVACSLFLRAERISEPVRPYSAPMACHPAPPANVPPQLLSKFELAVSPEVGAYHSLLTREPFFH